MLTTWIEAAAKGRHGSQVRAGMWSAVVVGTHPIESDQEVWLELNADDRVDRPACRPSGCENKGSQQPLARADPAPGRQRPTPLSGQG